MNHATPTPRDVRDVYGRRYRIGEDARDLTGHPRSVVLLAGGVLRDPPRHWWPADIDAQAWAIDRKLNRSIPHNAPAVRHYRPAEAMRTGALPLMWLTLALSPALSLFGIAFVVSYAVTAELGVAVAGFAAGMLAAVNGLGRSLAGHLSDRFGRRRVLAAVLMVEGFTHVGLVVAGGLIGVGVAASLVAAVGYRPLFLGAGLLGVLTALTVRFLKQPGRPALPVRPQLGTPVAGSGE